MGSDPKVSVVMICYNHERYIGEAINSVLSQTYSDFELIIVDDGSSDNTLKIIREYKDPRMIVVEQENSGPSIALNTGINKSRGQFIAFMSGDDVSLPNRLMTQIEQIEFQKTDMIFCLPQIIGPDSKVLNNNLCHFFFHRDFDSTAALYCQLFYSGNFLCAPSCFCRRTAIEKVGLFRRGLIQLQDFDYWIRACKKNLVIKLYKDVLLQYRYLYGGNLSDRRNMNRIELETLVIYRSFFDEASIDFLQKSFREKITRGAIDDCPDIEIDKSFLFFEHSSPTVKLIGIERIILQLEDDKIYEKLRTEREFDIARFFQLSKSNDIINITNVMINFRKKLKNIRNFLRDWRFIIIEGTRWTDTSVRKRIQNYLAQGDFDRAIKLAYFYKRYPPGQTKLNTIHKAFKKIFSKKRTIYKAPIDMGRVFLLRRMYDYSKQTNCIIHEVPPEKIYLKKPLVLGSFEGALFEGEAFSPREYVSVVDHAVITGGSSLVISRTGDLLSDEMMDFSTEDFGIKSPYVTYRSANNVILQSYEERPNSRIKEGILLSCDHDNNYFHWLVECLPKLMLIDDLNKFKNLPLLIPNGLHKNLKEALNRVNINNHPIINLDPGVVYHVDRLIFPSALSRVIDRYGGHVVFDTDIVLSHRWVSRVADLLKKSVQNKKKPWRKIYLTRRKGARLVGNQEEIELILQENKFEIVDLDDVSLDYQMELFSQASVVVAPTGAALTNMLFCQPGTRVIIFMSNHENTNLYFWSNLGDIAKLDVKIIAGDRLFNLTNYWSVHDDYKIDPKIVLDEIKKLE